MSFAIIEILAVIYVDGLHRLGDLAVDITDLGDELVAELADPEDLTDD